MALAFELVGVEQCAKRDENESDRELALSSNARSAGGVTRDAADPRGTQSWMRAHSGFLRALLLIFAYCSAVIALISMIAFRGVQADAIIAGTLCIAAVIAVFLLPRSRGAAK